MSSLGVAGVFAVYRTFWKWRVLERIAFQEGGYEEGSMSRRA
jgi:hypothetical protein